MNPEIVKYEPKAAGKDLAAAVQLEKEVIARLRSSQPLPEPFTGTALGAMPTLHKPYVAAFAPTGNLIAQVSPQRFQIADYATGRVVWERPMKTDQIRMGQVGTPVGWSHDSKRIAVSQKDHIEVLNVAEQKLLKELKFGGTIYHIGFSADGERIIGIGQNTKTFQLMVKQWATKDWTESDFPLPKHDTVNWCLSPSGDYLLRHEVRYTGPAMPLQIWHLKTGKLTEFVCEKALQTFSLHSDEKTLIALGKGKDGQTQELFTVDLTTGKYRTIIQEMPSSYFTPILSPDGKTIALEQNLPMVRTRGILVDAETGSEIWGRMLQMGNTFHFSPGGTLLALTPHHMGYEELSFQALEDLRQTAGKPTPDKYRKLLLAGIEVTQHGDLLRAKNFVGGAFKKDSFTLAAEEMPTIRGVILERGGGNVFEWDDVLDTLKKFPNLEELRVNEIWLTDKQIGKIAELKTLKKLTFILNGPLTNQGMAQLKTLEKLEAITLPQQQTLSDELLESLSGFKNLKVLELVACGKLTNKCAAFISKMKNLEVLRIIHCSNLDGRLLKDITDCMNLREIDLREFAVIDEDLPAFGKFPKLERLRISNGYRNEKWLTARGFENFTLPKSVKSLAITEGRIDITAEVLLRKIDLAQLEELDLTAFIFREEELRTLAAAKNLKTLRLSSKIEANLEKGLPELKSLERLLLPYGVANSPYWEEIRQKLPGVVIRNN